MRTNKDVILILVSEINDDLDNIDVIAESLASLPGKMEKSTEEDKGYIIESAGLKLHNFYIACERVFRKIAGDINGGLPSAFDWHMRLLNIMTLEIEGKRPPVIKKETARELSEYLKFRHLLTNVYGFELQAERILPLIESLPSVKKEFRKDIEEFLGFLKTVAG